MEYKKPKHKRKQPESDIVSRIKNLLERDGWFVKKLHGNKFQSGLPDLMCIHTKHGVKFVEVKTPRREGEKHGGLSSYQLREFKRMEAYGAKIYIMTCIEDVSLIYKIPNWYKYCFSKGRKRAVGF